MRRATGAGVVVAGRAGMFSGDFDLSTLHAAGTDAIDMVAGGFELAARVRSFPRPVNDRLRGHATTIGAFLVLSGEYRVGAAGPLKLAASEVSIRLTMPTRRWRSPSTSSHLRRSTVRPPLPRRSAPMRPCPRDSSTTSSRMTT